MSQREERQNGFCENDNKISLSLSLFQWVGAKQHELQVNSMQLLYYQV